MNNTDRTMKFRCTSIKCFLKDETGLALIEFAAVLPILFLLFAGVIEFSMAMYEWSQVNRLTQSGALYVIKNANNLYANSPFDSSAIILAAGKTEYGDIISVEAGCGCANNGSSISLSSFQGSPLPKCITTPVCNGGSSPMSPYVKLTTQHVHKTLIGSWSIGALKSSTLIRIQ